MTTTKQSWLKRSLAVLLAVMMVMSAGIANVFAAEKTTLEQLQDLIAYADTLEESNYTPESWKTFKEARDTIIDPTQIPERFQQMALEKLQGAIDQLVPVEQTDLEKLQSLLQKIDSMDSSLYTEESWNKLMDARKQIVDPTQIPDRFLANTISMLQSLVDGLVLKEGQTTQFDITVSEMQNGVVSTDVDKAAEGAIVTITVTPEPGFELKSITVMDESSKAVEVNDNKFKMPASNVFITAEFSKKEIVLEDGTYMAHFSGMDGYIYTRLSENIKILADDGEYTLTFYLSPGDTWLFEGDMYSNKQYMQYGWQDYRAILFEAMKPGASETEQLSEIGYAQKNLVDGYDLAGSGFTDAKKEKVSADNNELFYDTTYQKLENGKIAFSVTVDSLSEELFVNLLYERDEHAYESDEFDTGYYSSWGTISIDFSGAQKLPDALDEVEQTVSFNYDTMNTTMAAAFRTTSAKTAFKDGKLYVTYDITPNGIVSWVDGGQSTEILDENYQPITLQNETLTLEYSSLDELVAGKTIRAKTLAIDDYRGLVYRYAEATLIPYTAVTPVTLTDDTTGIKLHTSSKYVSENAQLHINLVTDTGSSNVDKNPWANMESHVQSYNLMTFFNFQVTDGEETVSDFGSSPILEIPIQEGMNKNNMRTFYNEYFQEGGQNGFRYGWFNKNGIVLGDIYSLIVDADYMSGNLAVYDEKLADTDGSDLKDGTYTVPITTFNESKPDETSMSASCLGGEATLVVKDGVKRLELNFDPVNIGSDKGYMIQMWYYNQEGELEELTYTSYYKNSDGSYYTDSFNEGTTDYYPSEGYMILPTDDAQFMTKFRVSAMDAIMAGGDATRDAIFTIYYDDAVKVSDETPDADPEEVIDRETADKTELNQMLEEANAKLEQAELYTDSSVLTLQNAVNSAEMVAVNDRSGQEEVDAEVEKLREAIEGLTLKDTGDWDINNLPDGKYTLYAQMIKTDRENFSMSNNAINHNVWLEVIDGEYYLTMQFKGLTIENKFGYLMNLSYYDAGYTYNNFGIPQGTLVPAEVLSTQKNADGTDVIDIYNDADHLYPEMIRLKLVDKAAGEYVPLHVFVPIMEAISDGTGSQDVLMKLDWSLLKLDDGEIKPEEPVEQSPAVNVTDSTTGIKIQADEGVFPEGVKLVVTPITSGADYDRAASILSDVGKKFRLFEIHFELDGADVQPNGIVTVYYPIPEGYDADKVVLYRINEDGTKTLVKGTVENGFYKVMTKSFSTYALVEQGSTITDAENSANVGSDIPQTGDSTNVLPFALLALASGGMIGVLCISRKRKFTEGE
ncbi:NEAT domain-containing protein [Anaeromassilibacillus sp. An172]|uniref:NEAT domain-containing protein n=1 Tax=Anaeromassilibacillus sp. An172 TaxID=1965570 RepID=UPI001302363C|nr:NEAT domain-containing protein [Anaeromassilibacillus sp. An172]